MQARQSVTSVRETEPAGNSEKSNTSRDCFAFDAFALLDATAFVADFDAAAAFAFVALAAFVTPEGFAFDAFGATDFLLAAVFFGASFLEAFDAAAFLPASFFTFDAGVFFAAFFAAGADFFAEVFELLLVAAI